MPQPSHTSSPFEALSFQFPFRKYQRVLLDHVEAEMASTNDNLRYHLMAPPGAGKTIVGLELVIRFGNPAVVFAPNSTIQAQWREKLGMFSARDFSARALCSLDPETPAPLSVFTYQRIATPADSRHGMREMAGVRWRKELIEEGRAVDEAAAAARLQTMRENNVRAFAREVARRCKTLKRELLREDANAIEGLLHPNAKRLIDDLVARGVQTVVLDECHHLLDYWAIVLRYLISRLPDARVIGLTATLPDPANDREYENYSALLGEVDFKVATPAIVKEGGLAPYRDLAYFVEPASDERDFLENIQREFESATLELTTSREFRKWVIERLQEQRDDSGDWLDWEEFCRQFPLFSLAALRFVLSDPMLRTEYALPDLLPLEALDAMTLEDWSALIENYALDVLKVSALKKHHAQLAKLKRALLPFGWTLTERGLRQSRSPGDLVLSLSSSKDEAAAHILARESRHLGEGLRALVVTDFARLGGGNQRHNIPAANGGAHRTFRHLAQDFETRSLAPVLVTGEAVLVCANESMGLLQFLVVAQMVILD